VPLSPFIQHASLVDGEAVERRAVHRDDDVAGPIPPSRP